MDRERIIIDAYTANIPNISHIMWDIGVWSGQLLEDASKRGQEIESRDYGREFDWIMEKSEWESFEIEGKELSLTYYP